MSDVGPATDHFLYRSNPGRVIFGSGTIANLAREADLLGIGRAIIVATAAQRADADAIAKALGARAGGVFAGAVMHTPTAITAEAMERLRALEADGIVAIGGGSSTGLGKALAYRTGLPQIVIPTTYAGSEMTPILGETQDGRKVTRSDPAILPETVIYDVDLTLGLPVAMSGTSGMNAIAHAIEALYAQERNPVISVLAIEAIGALARALPQIADQPGNVPARRDALYGAWLCGTCLGSVGMALHHKLCHTLGGMFDLPHAELHTIILPHALAYNAPSIPDVIDRLRLLFEGVEAPEALYALARRIGAKTALRDLGMPESGIDAAVEQALAHPYWNPRPLDAGAIRTLIANAWAGTAPARPAG